MYLIERKNTYFFIIHQAEKPGLRTRTEPQPKTDKN